LDHSSDTVSYLLTTFQVIDPHTHQYLDRLKDEPLFLALAQKVSDHLARTGDTKSLARVALRRIEHFYYKTDAVYDAMRKLALQQKEAANAVQVTHPSQISISTPEHSSRSHIFASRISTTR